MSVQHTGLVGMWARLIGTLNNPHTAPLVNDIVRVKPHRRFMTSVTQLSMYSTPAFS
jgi:hypothetical protein